MFAGRTVYKVVFEYSLVDEYIKIDSPVIVDQMVLNRYKPVGWRSESYRHYLAAKGMKTRYTAHKYFANDFLKGDRREILVVDPKTGKEKNLIKVGHAHGLTDNEMRMRGVNVPVIDTKATDFNQLAANVMPAVVNDEQYSSPERFTSLVAEPIPKIASEPIQSATPIVSDVVEAPLQSSFDLETPDESEVIPEIKSVQPLETNQVNEDGMVGDVSTVPAPQMVNFDNYGSS